ncbi:MAG: GNAT family N-acetyltransferase, partial [Promethearchaeota archaeon]
QSIIKAIIREAKQEDLDSLKNIYNRAWLTSNTPFRPITKTDLSRILGAPDTVFLIAKVYGIDAAFVLLDFEGEDKEYAVIAALAVLPRFQRRGLGKILGMYIWNYIKQNYHNIKEIRAEVYKGNRVSHAFMTGIGFKEYERRIYRKEDFEIDIERL